MHFRPFLVNLAPYLYCFNRGIVCYEICQYRLFIFCNGGNSCVTLSKLFDQKKIIALIMHSSTLTFISSLTQLSKIAMCNICDVSLHKITKQSSELNLQMQLMFN